MNQPQFLKKLTDELMSVYSNELSSLTIVLPSKRARVFLIEHIQSQLLKPIFTPNIISIEDFIQDVSGLRSIDSIEVLFEFYNVYNAITDASALEDFETFAKWAKIIIQDFNEIDRYLLEQKRIFSYLKEVEALKRWNLELNESTKLIDVTLDFWNKLPLYYDSLYQHLLQKKVGYQGLLYREAIHNLKFYTHQIPSSNTIIFAGFNALNKAEEIIFQHLLLHNKAKVYWDIDYSILQDPFHDAGFFIRKYKNKWKHYAQNPFQWIETHFENEKNIHIIGTPKTVGQTKIVGNLIEELQQTQPNLQNTAVVLGDENLLLPVLFNLPQTVDSLNITMGYPSKSNPAQLLITKIFKLHLNAKQRNEKQYTFYYKEVLDILNHALVMPYSNASAVERIIKENNFTFFSSDTLFKLFDQHKSSQDNDLFELIFLKWNDNATEVLSRLKKIILTIKLHLNNNLEEDRIAKAFLHSIFSVLNRIDSFIETYKSILTVSGLYAIYKNTVDIAEVSFEGMPLSGLQIMGVLESRVLDFENIIITSVNEGKFPSAKSVNSFIPYDIKIEEGLPTFREKDAIYSYHFYHLLYRAKNIYLIYNSENSDGIDSGEKSRFITQLEIDFPHLIKKNTIYNAHLPSLAYQPIEIEKTPEILNRLKEIATGRGFSPSSLTTYIRNPIQFYTQQILSLKEVDDVEENIEIRTLGTIIHETLKNLYNPYVGTFLSITILESIEKNIETETIKQFKNIYKEGDILKGKNLLAFEVAKQQVALFLNLEKELLLKGDTVKILFLEQRFSGIISDNSLSYDVIISGSVDRIELRNNTVRIIDYKTGKVEGKNLVLDDFSKLTLDTKYEKIIQLLCYVLMFENNEDFKNHPIEAGIISFKNFKSGFMPFLSAKKQENNAISDEVMKNFKVSLSGLIHQILDKDIPFLEII